MSKRVETSVSLGRVLLIDADPAVLESLGPVLAADGFDVAPAASSARAMDHLAAGRFALVIADANMRAIDGTDFLRYCRRHDPSVPVIVTSAHATIPQAVEAFKQGASEYLTKPLALDALRGAAAQAVRQRQADRAARGAASGRNSLDNIIGSDFRMTKIFDLVDAVGDSRTTVLITGESGTGKSMIARAVHANSPRRDKPFVEVSCGALPDTLLESELFGHVKGAFTNAVCDKMGKFAAANGGTIFLDEISSASPQLQVKLLRVLQERQFEPVGSNATQEVEVRVILATNHNMMAEVEAGRFRRDLYYRINVVNIELPPLRERVGDIPLLAEFFLRKYLAATPKDMQGIAPAAMEVMQRYHWPGNVRELENCVERAVVLCRQNMIGPDDLPPAVLAGARRGEPLAVPSGNGHTLHDALLGPERQIIVATLATHHGNRQQTAAQLGINRTTLYKKMKKYGLLDE